MFDPAVVGDSLSIFNLGNEQQVDGIATVVFCKVERMDPGRFSVFEYVDDQVVQSFHLWNFTQRGGKVWSGEVQFVLIWSYLESR